MKFAYLLYVLLPLFLGVLNKKRYLEDPSYNPITNTFENQDYSV